MFSLENKTCLVTGAASGIGAAIAETFARAKAFVYVTDRDEKGGHQTVTHSKGEYVRGVVHTNTVEGFFSLFKRGLMGTFHHVSVGHLPRYLAEFDFRYNLRTVTDGERTTAAIKATEGKRLRLR